MASVSEKTPIPKKTRTAVISPVNANVLVIEDNPDIMQTLGMILMGKGYGVRPVSSRDEALRVLSHYLYDVIIMDLFMPGIGPVEFIKEARLRCPRSQYILLTASEHVEKEADTLGILHWIGKPFDPDDVLEAVRQCTERIPYPHPPRGDVKDGTMNVE